MRSPGAVILVASLALSVSCSYSLVGRGSFLPGHIHRMAVPAFHDRTGWPALQETVTRAVTEKLISRSGIKVQSSETDVDAVLQGTVLRFEQTPIAFREGYATTYQVTITAGVKLRDLVDNKVIYNNPSFMFRSEYDVQEDFTSFYDASQESVEEIAADFAEQLVATLVEGF